MKKLIILFTIISIVSCKERTKDSPKNTIKEEFVKKVEDTIYKVALYGVFKEDIKQSMWFTEDQNENFDSKRYLIKSIVGSETAQEVLYEIPRGKFLEKFRIRPVDNKNIKSIRIDSFKIIYNDKSITIKPEDYIKSFKVNQYVKLDSISPYIHFQEKSINGKLIFDPFIISSDKLADHIFNL